MQYVYIIAAFLFLILIHEFGHFIVAKLNGVYVEEFSIGMGPKIFGIKGKETSYNLRLIPIGGYVKMYGEDAAEEENMDIPSNRSFDKKNPYQKIAIIFAGAFMNIVFAIVLFAIYSFNTGITYPIVNEVLPESSLAIAGVKQGDIITKVNNMNVLTSLDLNMGITTCEEPLLLLEIDRNGEKKIFSIDIKNSSTDFIDTFSVKHNTNPSFTECIKDALKTSVSITKQVFIAVKDMFTGKANLKTDVAGPISIIKMSSNVAKQGLTKLLFFFGLISVQLGIFNLLPIPALDGGLISIEVVQLVIRKKISKKVLNIINTTGFILLLALMAIVTLKDIFFPII